MLSVQPSIDAGLARIAPQFRALSMLVEAAPLVHPQVGEAALTRACAEVMAGGPVWAQAHLDALVTGWKQDREGAGGVGAASPPFPCTADALPIPAWGLPRWRDWSWERVAAILIRPW